MNNLIFEIVDLGRNLMVRTIVFQDVFLVGLVLSIIGYVVYRGALTRERALSASLLAFILGMVLCIAHFWYKASTLNVQAEHPGFPKGFPSLTWAGHRFWHGVYLDSLWVFLTAWFALPLVMMLYRAWRKARSGDADWKTELAGPHGWHLFWVGGLALFGGLAFGFHVSLIVILIAGVFVPFLESSSPREGAASTSRVGQIHTPPRDEDLTAERGRVLKLLEEGKINAEECGELLTALGESARSRTAPRPLGAARKMAIVGAVLVVTGFFLPWFAVDLNKLMGQVTQQMGATMTPMPDVTMLPLWVRPQNMLNFPGNASFNLGGVGFGGGVLRIAGGNVPYGLGWAVLLLAVIVAFAPLEAFWPHPVLRRKIALLLLGIGAFLLLYLLTQNFHFISFGLTVVVAGYALELAGTIKSRPTMN